MVIQHYDLFLYTENCAKLTDQTFALGDDFIYIPYNEWYIYNDKLIQIIILVNHW